MPTITPALEQLLDSRRVDWRTASRLTTLIFNVLPIPKGRPRAIIVQSKGRPIAILKNDPETEEFEQSIARAAQEFLIALCGVWPRSLVLHHLPENPMSVVCDKILFPITGWRLGAEIDYVTHKNNQDVDNLVKSLLDGMQKIVYDNDKDFEYLEPLRIVTNDHAPLIRVCLLTLGKK